MTSGAIDEDVLEAVAKDGTMDYEKWPSLLDPLIERLEHIIHNDFPMPTVPPSWSRAVDTPSLIPSSYSTQEVNSQANSNKENAPPSQLQTPPRRPPVPAFPSSSSSERIPDSQPQSGPTDDALPPPLVAILSSIKSTLKTYFSAKPPHTIQRLAELILRPTRDYRTLPAYLRAVDRVVSVSSGADIFPLPVSMPLPGGIIDTNLVNGVNGTGSSSFTFSYHDALGSDESLGGALLTPIPWLNNSDLPGGKDVDDFVEPYSSPNSSAAGISEPGSSSPSSSSAIPPREPGAVTQGEFIRQEQEAGVVPTTEQHERQRQHQTASFLGGEGRAVEAHGDEFEEVPHARGPNILGVEDMGLQDGKGVEMSLSTSPPRTDIVRSGGDSVAGLKDTPQGATDNDSPSGSDLKDDTGRDADGDILIGDIPEKPVKETSEDQPRPNTATMPSEELKPENEELTKSTMEIDEGPKESNTESSGSDNRMDA
ncbi:hypothetical protein ACJ73_03733 [Blastomyces percursus]|uniref:Protein phosphatase 4 core regulatory subunit R2 n=1 Tax=Blastomyces percursus TaxID=1658174 RepID=A0A1J9Q7Y6_9EURO|nr:hypothetical protein ACJ73_03733 [Blastomyces percursus]